MEARPGPLARLAAGDPRVLYPPKCPPPRPLARRGRRLGGTAAPRPQSWLGTTFPSPGPGERRRRQPRQLGSGRWRGPEPRRAPSGGGLAGGRNGFPDLVPASGRSRDWRSPDAPNQCAWVSDIDLRVCQLQLKASADGI